MHNSTSFRIGNYRPIYLWAGPGTIRMNKLKFMGVDVDEKVHLDAHEPQGVERVVDILFQNWIHLTYSWGFPPEVEEEDWISFENATNVYHQKNVNVFAYIQTSNCVFDKSFTSKDWYAQDPNGRKVYYYSGRYMTCFQNQDWINYLHERITDAIKRGTDGIFFDNLWYGLQPNSLFNTWLGGAGCYCPTCQQIYRSDMNSPIPTFTDLNKQEVIDYIEWRARKMTEVFQELAEYTRQLKPDVIISANDYDPVMRPTKLIFGIDFQELAKIQDVTMIENFALPKWERTPERKLVNNVLTIRNSQPFLPEGKHLSVLSYDAGIGFDPVYPTRRILTGMAEAAANGCSMVTKGTEYHDGEKMTLLTAPEYSEQQQAIGEFHHWLEDHQDIYQKQTQRFTSVAILYPGDRLWQNWHEIAPLFFAVQQTLITNGIPWQVIKDLDQLKNQQNLIIFDNTSHPHEMSEEVTVINAFNLSNWKAYQLSFFNNHLLLRKGLSKITDQLIHGYHASKFMRKLMDWFGMSKLVTHTPFFTIPDESFQNGLLAKLNVNNQFRVISENPVLIDVWDTVDEIIHVHLVNYLDKIQTVKLKFPQMSTIKIIQKGKNEETKVTNTDEITINLDLYCICILQKNEV